MRQRPGGATDTVAVLVWEEHGRDLCIMAFYECCTVCPYGYYQAVCQVGTKTNATLGE